MLHRKNKILITFTLIILFFISVVLPLLAEENTKGSKQNTFNLEVTGNLINLQAQKASFKEILKDLEKKTGVKINILDGVDDREVSLDIKSLPVYDVGIILERMSVNNFAIVYDQQLASKVIFILPADQDINEIIKDKSKPVVLSSDIININVAQFVAEKYLHKYYPEEWVYFDTLTLYNLDSQPVAYALIFHKPDSEITTLQKLEDNILAINSELASITKQISQIELLEDISDDEKKNKTLLLKTQLKDKKKLLYRWESFATVLTGATKTSSLVIDHYRGLPPMFVAKDDLQKSLKSNYLDKNLKLGRMLFLSPFDIRYEVTSNNITTQLIAENSYVMDIKTKSLEKISFLKEKIKKSAARKARKRDLMNPEERYKYDLSIQERNKENIQNWQNYEKLFNK